MKKRLSHNRTVIHVHNRCLFGKKSIWKTLFWGKSAPKPMNGADLFYVTTFVWWEKTTFYTLLVVMALENNVFEWVVSKRCIKQPSFFVQTHPCVILEYKTQGFVAEATLHTLLNLSYTKCGCQIRDFIHYRFEKKTLCVWFATVFLLGCRAFTNPIVFVFLRKYAIKQTYNDQLYFFKPA